MAHIKINLEQFQDSVASTVAKFIEQLYGDISLTRTNIQHAIECQIKLLNSECMKLLKEFVLSLISDKNGKATVNLMFAMYQNMYEGLNTEHKRLKLLEKVGVYTEPIKYLIGPSFQYTTTGQGHPIDLSGSYISMIVTLKKFLELPNVLKTILTFMESLENQSTSIIKNPMQCTVWKTKIKPQFGDEIVLPFNLYSDAFDPCDPLGPKSGTHSLTGVYFDLPCVPPQYRGRMENIFTAAMFYASDKYFGTAEVFRPILNELKHLEKEGIQVCIDGEEPRQIYFAMLTMTGDNLGIHEALGLTTGFSGHYPCRICEVHRDTLRTQIKLDCTLIRTKESYEKDLLQVANTGKMSTGIKERCIFNALDSFHLIENKTVDLPHDLAEGVFPYVMVPIIKYFISKNRFTVDRLSSRIDGFYYGSSEISNKPPPITKDHLTNNSLHYSASQMLCFVRCFGLMIGDRVDVKEDEKVWRLWSLLRSILDIVYAPYIDLEIQDLLRHLIQEHHKLYLELFPELSLKFKFHMMLHYPDILVEMGPLSTLSSMEFERKHKQYKNVAHDTNNYCNLPQTLLIREQLKFAARLIGQNGFKFEVESGKRKECISIREINNSKEFSAIIPPHVDRVGCVKTIKIFGTKYDLTMAVVIDLDYDFPTFGEIKFICVDNNNPKKIYFVGKKFLVESFSDHYHAYEGIRTEEWFFVPYDSLKWYQPTHIRIGMDKKLYATYRHKL